MLADSLDENWKKISELLNKDNDEDSDSTSDEDKKTVAQIALDLAEDHCSELFTDQYGTPFAAVNIDKHQETLL